MMARKPGKNALYFILVTVFIDMMGFSIIMPVMPKLIMGLTGENISDAAGYGAWLLSLYAVMQFFISPVMGNLSDRFGRRPVLLLSLFGYFVDYLIMGFATTLGWLFFGRIMSGAFAATFSTANAYIADVSPPEKKAQNFGLIGAAFGLGFIFGPVIGGFLGEYDPRMPFFAAAGLAFINMLYGIFVLPETLAEEDRRPFSLTRANPVGSLVQMRAFPVVFGLAAAIFLFQLAHTSLPSTWSYYGIEKFSWSEREIGFSLALIGVTAAIVQGGLTRVLIPKMGERRAAFFGIVVMMLAFVAYAFATEGWMVYVIIVTTAIAGITGPAMQGVMSNAVPKNQQGELQGAMSSLMALTMIIGPWSMLHIFGYFSAPGAPVYFPGAAFMTAAVLTLLSLWPLFRGLRTVQKPGP